MQSVCTAPLVVQESPGETLLRDHIRARVIGWKRPLRLSFADLDLHRHPSLLVVRAASGRFALDFIPELVEIAAKYIAPIGLLEGRFSAKHLVAAAGLKVLAPEASADADRQKWA